MQVYSPLTGKQNCKLIKRINTSEIIEIYKKSFSMNVSRFFTTETISLYRCLDTEFEFYYPFDSEGDESYYSELGKLKWYYDNDRWEHNKALELINQNDVLLEIGSGGGAFLSKLRKKTNIDAIGLELSKNAIKIAEEKDIKLASELIQEHERLNSNKYTKVCSFQVLEHIAEPYSFISSSVNCLKEGGELIVGVPNNDSFIKNNIMNNRVLNMPPHHMGLWNVNSLKALESIFKIHLVAVNYEPLSGPSEDIYIWNKLNSILKIEFLCKILWKLKIQSLVKKLIKILDINIKGSSMIAVFKKI